MITFPDGARGSDGYNFCSVKVLGAVVVSATALTRCARPAAAWEAAWTYRLRELEKSASECFILHIVAELVHIKATS